MEYTNQLETQDLILSKAKQEDLENIFKNYWSSEKSAKYMLWEPQKNLKEAQERLDKTIKFQKDYLVFFVYEKSTGKAIVQAAMLEIEPGIYEDAGIGLGENYVGKGYGKQILKCFINYIFGQLGANKIVCSCHTDNLPSAKMQQACGLKYDCSKISTMKKIKQLTRQITIQSQNKIGIIATKRFSKTNKILIC